MSYHWHAPLDPECPQVKSYNKSSEEDYEFSLAIGAPMDEINAAWEEKHRARCERCQLYGAENVEVAGP